jgi:hypothetical protein
MNARLGFAANKKQTTLFINIGWFAPKEILKITVQDGGQ